ncbi:MAG: alpha-amylase, partial [Candidatus Altiarchaeales archaeon]|nr:alpha-amylase [Candidatus Altiarchaeales archaeon]
MISQNDIIYFIVTDRFCDGDPANNEGVDKGDPLKYHGGDFTGIIEKIPYLQNLGITALWITPVYLSIGRYHGGDGYHGYWALDFEKIDPHLYSK